MAKRNEFVETYVKHLPQIGIEDLGKSGAVHVVFGHDDACRIFVDGETCDCDPTVRLFAAPVRS
jgi:hypothetical protein